MALEPPPSRWALPVSAEPDEHGLVAVGADLEPGTLLAAYRSGLFPMPLDGVRGGPLGWWSPDPRGVLPLDGMHVSRSLRKACRRYEVRVDTAFAEVVAGCADRRRPGAWITPEMAGAYGRLAELGWAHSIEAWDEEGLAGGVYGVAVGGLFAGESMFSRRRDASKVALVAAVELLAADADDRRLFDVQWATDHLRSLGVVEVPRGRYLELVARAQEAPLPGPWAGAGPVGPDRPDGGRMDA